MAGQKQGVRWLLAAAVAVALSGCVSVPDAIKGTSPDAAAGFSAGDERAAAVRWPGSALWR